MVHTIYQYENSLTIKAKETMDKWTDVLANMSDEFMKKPLKVVKKLNNSRNICTPGFLMRRQIQETFHDLLETATAETHEVYADLFESKNVPWPEPLIRNLSSKLEKFARENYNEIVKKNSWISWLTDESFPTKRELAVKLSFLLSMDDYTTTKFLLSCGHEPFSVRNPFDCICLFCKQLHPKGDWKKVTEILSQYEKNRPQSSTKKSSKRQTVGSRRMSRIINDKIPELANATAPEYQLEDVQNGLIAYLYSIDNELTRREKITSGPYLSGYSLERCQRFLELTRFLAVLYPEYDNAVYSGGDRRENIRTKRKGSCISSYETKYTFETIKKVSVDSNGYPNLNDLSKAFVYAHDWDFAEPSGLGLVEYDKDKGKAKYRTSAKKDYHDKKIPFNREVYRICQSYSEENRLARITLLPNQKEIDLPIERKDILLMAFLFISGYSRWKDAVEYSSWKNADENINPTELFDQLTGIITENPDDAFFSSEITSLIGRLNDVLNLRDKSEMIKCYIDCINNFLELFNFELFYPPFLLDRFILFALVAEEIGSTSLGDSCLPENLTSIWLYDGYADMPEKK